MLENVSLSFVFSLVLQFKGVEQRTVKGIYRDSQIAVPQRFREFCIL